MQGEKQVIAHLNDLLAGELTAIDQYFIHSRMYQNWGFSKLYERINHEVQDETSHADALIKRMRSFNHVYPCRLKSPKIVSTYNQVDTYDGEQESFISTIGRGAAERWPLSV